MADDQQPIVVKRINAPVTLSGATWAPNTVSYTGNNRTHMIRIPEPGRFECRLPSGAVNPYLGMAGFAAAGLDGIHRKLDPGLPAMGKNMYTLSRDEVTRSGLGLIPQSLPEALAAFEQDPVVQEAIGEPLATEFLKVKRQEWVRYHSVVSTWELERYLTLF